MNKKNYYTKIFFLIFRFCKLNIKVIQFFLYTSSVDTVW